MEAERAQSRHTYRQIHLLGQSSTKSALRVIALVDYDAFYAQCESVRLGLPESTPLAVRQWNAIIALNYPARQRGLRRGASVDEAKKQCPDIVLQHVPTWREGDLSWAYRSDVLEYMRTDKSALDPYRRASRQSLELIKRWLPPTPIQCIERASVDEVFLDLSAQVHEILRQRYPEPFTVQPQNLDDFLPLPDVRKLDWQTTFVFGNERDESRPVDWDDVALSIGSEIVQRLREEIFRCLRYTSSAGIARNKSLAKLAAGYRKPNQQTVILNSDVHSFLNSLKFTKIGGLGRDLGHQVSQAFATDQVSELLHIPLSTLQSVIGLEAGLRTFNLIRGTDESEVISRIQVQSMLSVKTFVPKINAEQAAQWLHILVADLLNRLADQEAEGHHVRPTTMALFHHIDGRFGPTRSKQRSLSERCLTNQQSLLAAARGLLKTLSGDKGLWPCRSLSLQLSGFEQVKRIKKPISAYFNVAANPGSEPDVGECTANESPNSSANARYLCPHCSKAIEEANVLEHLDWHVAVDLSS